MVQRSMLAPPELGRFYGLDAEPVVKLDASMLDQALPYGGNESTGEPSLQELQTRCLDFVRRPLVPGAIPRDRAVKAAGWEGSNQNWPGAQVIAHFGSGTHYHWYQELPTGDRIDFLRDRLIWLVNFSHHEQSNSTAFDSRPTTKRHSAVVDAGTGRRVISYRFP